MLQKKFKQLLKDRDSKELLKGASKSLLFKLTGLLTAYFFAFVVARFLGADAWGEFTLALAVITLGGIIGSLGFDKSIIKLSASAVDRFEASKYYRSSIVIAFAFSILISILCFTYSPWIAEQFFNNSNLNLSIKISSFAILPTSLIMINSGAILGIKEISSFAFIQYVSMNLITLIILIAIVNYMSETYIVVLSFVIGAYVVALFSAIWLSKSGLHLFGSVFFINQWISSGLFTLSIPLLFAGILLFIKGWIDTIMVGIYLTEQDVGIYNIALKLSGLATIIYVAISNIAAPKFAELFTADDSSALNNVVQKSTRLIFFLSLPIVIVLLLFSEQILAFFGDEFRGGSTTLLILTFAACTKIVSGSVGYFLNMTESQKAFLAFTAFTAFSGIALNYLLIPRYGIEGAAIATFIGLLFWNLSCVLFIKKKYRIKTYITLSKEVHREL